MPLPDKFYDADGVEVTLETLCRKEPGWAANRLRYIQAELDEANSAQKFVRHIAGHLQDGQLVICTICGKSIDEIAGPK